MMQVPESLTEEKKSARDGRFSRPQENEQTKRTVMPEIDVWPQEALGQLWRLWDGEKPTLRRLCCQLDAASVDSCFACEDKREWTMLKQVLNSFARQRLEKLRSAGASDTTDLDEQAVFHTTQNEMAVWMVLFPPVGQGKELNMVQLLQKLAEHRVACGLDLKLLKYLPTGPQRYFNLFLVARGKAPVPGSDGKVEERFPRTLEWNDQVDELGRADYSTLGLVQSIEEGEVICTIVPPTQGTAGYTVTGRPLPPPPGKPAKVPQGRNTVLSEDGKYLLAARSGHIGYNGQVFHVKPILDIPGNAVASMGSINFLGDIHVHGDVCSGVSVRALGSVQVDGVIEDCQVEAGEHIIVSSGVQGQERAVLRAQKSVFAKYLEQCHIYARESVQSDCIINCDISCNGPVRARTGRGILLGGIVRSSTEVSARVVGSKAERPTVIELGGFPCDSYEREQIVREIERSEGEIHELSSAKEKGAVQDRQSKLRLELCVARMKLEKFDREMGLRNQIAGEHDPRRLVCDEAYPGTVVTISNDSYRVRQMEHSCVIGVQNGYVGRIKGGQT